MIRSTRASTLLPVSDAVLLRDPWLRGCAATGVLMLAVTAISGLPWPLWLAWSYVALLSAWEAASRT